MPPLRSGDRGASGFFINPGLTLYPKEQLWQEMTFLSYYLHWPREDVMSLDHLERRRWCREVSDVNRKLNGPDKQNKIELK